MFPSTVGLLSSLRYWNCSPMCKWWQLWCPNDYGINITWPVSFFWYSEPGEHHVLIRPAISKAIGFIFTSQYDSLLGPLLFVFNTFPLASITRLPCICMHMHSGDTDLYTTMGKQMQNAEWNLLKNWIYASLKADHGCAATSWNSMIIKRICLFSHQPHYLYAVIDHAWHADDVSTLST